MKQPVSKRVITPVGVLSFASLWEKDVYRDEKSGVESKAKYKADLLLDPDETEPLWVAVYEVGQAGGKYSAEQLEQRIQNEIFRIPIKDGDFLKEQREAHGKSGDLYAGKEVLRTGTVFNGDGQDAPGGIYVVDQSAERISWDRRGVIYPGCLMRLSVDFRYYKAGMNEGVVAYLNAAQLAGEGEPIGQDRSMLFTPLA